MRKSLLLCSLFIAMAGCGGSDHQPLVFLYQGTVSGPECSSGFPESIPVAFSVQIVDWSAGAPVTLVDQSGETWTGAMSSASSFTVTDPAGDRRRSIVLTDISGSSANAAVTAGCMSFRCCTTLSGHLAA